MINSGKYETTVCSGISPDDEAGLWREPGIGLPSVPMELPAPGMSTACLAQLLKPCDNVIISSITMFPIREEKKIKLIPK